MQIFGWKITDKEINIQCSGGCMYGLRGAGGITNGVNTFGEPLIQPHQLFKQMAHMSPFCNLHLRPLFQTVSRKINEKELFIFSINF